MTRMIKAILFDLDGVLVDTEKLHSISYIEALKKYGVNIKEEEYYDFWTRKGKGIADFTKERNIHYNPKEIRARKIEIYHRHLKKHLPVIDGAAEKLEELSLKYPLALVSSSYRDSIGVIMSITGLGKFFKSTVSGDDVPNPKPSPEGFLLAAKNLGVRPEECAVIEDAEKGVIAAKEAGMFCVAIPTEITKNNDFSRADVVLKSIKGLDEKVWLK